MTRIIAGVAGGRRIAVPPGQRTRPTTDRTREALFSSLVSLLGPLDGARVLDLYAGSGALGLEALSRGAERALLVENDAKALRALRANVRDLGLPGAQVAAEPVERVVGAPPGSAYGGPYDVVLADPPYATTAERVERVLADLIGHGWLADGAVVAVERSSRGLGPAWPAGLVAERERRYGEATLWYGRADRRS
ncbi:MAG: 16S rRNA (guanine(966)-N(2))-methyltransferase RsmD [Actinomycetota bacterium]|nr:16S rRNA (guanine(966)-N(2))-methyltransferase RsmD [Actinomycetota bacterium]